MAQPRNSLRKHGLRSLAVAATAGLTLTLAPAIASAAPAQEAAKASPTATSQAQAMARWCKVNDNGVNYRSGPGQKYKVFGTVNKGRKFNVRGQQGNWYMGNLKNGRTGVWIHVAYVNC